MSQEENSPDPTTEISSPQRRSRKLSKLSSSIESLSDNSQKLPVSSKKEKFEKLEDESENIEEEKQSEKQNGIVNDHLLEEDEKTNIDEINESNRSSLDSSKASSRVEENSLESSFVEKENIESNKINSEINIENIKRTLNKILRSNINKYKIDKMLKKLRKKYIDINIDEILSILKADESSDEESETNSFIDSMAEEGEEDTPSEGSCDIPDIGEAINTTESEFSTDDSYDNDSFINDDERFELLSGEEFDLSDSRKNKKSRILKLDIDSDEEIVRIKPKKKILPKKKSRIIRPRMDDSSDEEATNENKDFNENLSINSAPDINKLSDVKDQNAENQEECKIPVIEENEVDTTSISEKLINAEKSELAKNEDTINENNKDSTQDQKIIILENIRVQDIENEDLSKNIKNIITSFCRKLKTTGQNGKQKKKQRRKLKKKNILLSKNDGKTGSSQNASPSENAKIRKKNVGKSKHEKKKKVISPLDGLDLDHNAENKKPKKLRKKKRKHQRKESVDFDNFRFIKKRKLDNSTKFVPDIEWIVNNRQNNVHKSAEWIVNEITLKPS